MVEVGVREPLDLQGFDGGDRRVHVVDDELHPGAAVLVVFVRGGGAIGNELHTYVAAPETEHVHRRGGMNDGGGEHGGVEARDRVAKPGIGDTAKVGSESGHSVTIGRAAARDYGRPSETTA